jgi:hypothetical protein
MPGAMLGALPEHMLRASAEDMLGDAIGRGRGIYNPVPYGTTGASVCPAFRQLNVRFDGNC